ncbi:MAG: hypothetical protein Q4G24_16165 [Paracoccus sp. (in: a-proteobacteria)]|uniref:hypothetical protein n=1 Tax=Paracoccus sp. TaxID=267 RepID=UPI0026DF119B|nr:hypothetical protein [Paracoccus sp. (in: a-proteobacteria)]MDO5622982.1 hypothetical protein [Paracoccus sp. (in: a-proteobacteria)]
MKYLFITILTGAAIFAAYVFTEAYKSMMPTAAQDIPCHESQTRYMVRALTAIFPDADFGAPEHSACEAPHAVGVDTAGVLVFGEGADLTGVGLAAPADPQFLPLDRIDALVPEFDLLNSISDYHVAYGFARDRNSEAYVLRKADGTGPLIVLVADML